MPHETPRSQTSAGPGYPWRPFLREIDEKLSEAIQLQCLGGFVVTQHYGLGRETSDIDCIAVIGSKPIDFAGAGSDLHKKYRVYLQYVTIATPPCDYDGRLQRMFPKARWKHLKLFALDATDLALSKLERNFDRDRDHKRSKRHADFQSSDRHSRFLSIPYGACQLPSLAHHGRIQARQI